MKYLIFVSLFFLFSMKGFAADAELNLAQFESDNLATILGLDKKESITVDDVKKARKNLSQKFHPDKVLKLKLSDEERNQKLKTYEVIFKKIRAAATKLTEFIKLNPDYNPSLDKGASSYQSRTQHNAFYSWEDLRKEQAERKQKNNFAGPFDIVHESYYERGSINGTNFDFLNEYPLVEVAYFPFKSASKSLSSPDIIIIIRRSEFPSIEVKYIQNGVGEGPSLIQTKKGIYKRRAAPTATGEYSDMIQLDDYTHLRFSPQAYANPFFAPSVIQMIPVYEGLTYESIVNVKTNRWTIMEYSGDMPTGDMFYSRHDLTKAEDLIPLEGPKPKWKTLQLSEEGKVIFLPDNSKRIECLKKYNP